MKYALLTILFLFFADRDIKKGDEIIFIKGTSEDGSYRFVEMEENHKPLNPLFNGIKVIVKKIKTRRNGSEEETLLYVSMTSGKKEYVVHFEDALEAGEIKVK